MIKKICNGVFKNWSDKYCTGTGVMKLLLDMLKVILSVYCFKKVLKLLNGSNLAKSVHYLKKAGMYRKHFNASLGRNE